LGRAVFARSKIVRNAAELTELLFKTGLVAIAEAIHVQHSRSLGILASFVPGSFQLGLQESLEKLVARSDAIAGLALFFAFLMAAIEPTDS